ncbi:MAG TPA: hypothetical protein VMW56_02870 [Candidatus Margulisiibacteriota bacterium]|nr:hypothetical protein [Candidatus Margulisiibacteriota bacterium]
MEIVAVGLCAQCQHCRIGGNARGSTFYRCALADIDSSFTRYPRLPVLRCSGYDPGVAQEHDD